VRVPIGKFSSQMVHHSLLLPCSCLSGQGISDRWLGRGELIPWSSHSPDLIPLERAEVQNMSFVTEYSELQSVLSMKYLSLLGEKLIIILMCRATNSAILRYTENIRNCEVQCL
jgi:hypothetical protein